MDEASICDSCGAPDPELLAVNRVYVTPAAADRPRTEQVIGDVERWCYSCCTHYPHRLVS